MGIEALYVSIGKEKRKTSKKKEKQQAHCKKKKKKEIPDIVCGKGRVIPHFVRFPKFRADAPVTQWCLRNTVTLSQSISPGKDSRVRARSITGALKKSSVLQQADLEGNFASRSSTVEDQRAGQWRYR